MRWRCWYLHRTAIPTHVPGTVTPTEQAPDDRQDIPATPYLRHLTADKGWRGELIRDRHGEPVAIVTVRIGPDWTDAVVIEGEDRCVTMRQHTRDDRLIVPSEPPDGSGAVWVRDGRCEDVLAELFELPEARPQ